jgi:hypothetical protein
MSRAENELFILRDPATLENMRLPELLHIRQLQYCPVSIFNDSSAW